MLVVSRSAEKPGGSTAPAHLKLAGWQVAGRWQAGRPAGRPTRGTGLFIEMRQATRHLTFENPITRLEKDNN